MDADPLPAGIKPMPVFLLLFLVAGMLLTTSVLAAQDAMDGSVVIRGDSKMLAEPDLNPAACRSPTAVGRRRR
jgi:hypothetical protein